MSGSTNKQKLAELRGKIDAVDDKIIELLRERSTYVHEVGQLKQKDAAKCMIRPQREAEMVRRIVKKAEGIFPPEYIVRIWRNMIAGSTTLEQKLTTSIYAPEGNVYYIGVTRDYFGPFLPSIEQKNPKHVLYDLVGEKALIGVLPLKIETKDSPWWVELTDMVKPPLVFAHLPFYAQKGAANERVVALGYVEYEATSEDITLVVVKDQRSISRETLIQQAEKLGFGAEEIAKFDAGATIRYQLYALKGFFAQDCKQIADLQENLKKYSTTEFPPKLTVIGHYAVPISLG